MFKGSIVALVTPFDEAGEIDFAALALLVTFHLDTGTDALVVGGSTGESATLRAGELQALLKAVVSQVRGRIPVIAGTGAAATDHTIDNTRMAADHGADAALVVTPYYNRPTQHGLLQHFRAVADSSDLPVILYNVPSRTGVDLQPETVQLLASHERIVAIKEAVGRVERIEALCRLRGGDFSVLSGDDNSCLQAMRHGARGVISVAANVVPGRFKAICQAAARHDWEVAELEESRLRRLFDLLMIETNPIPVKWALHEMSLCSPQLRLPLTPLSASYREALHDCLAELGDLNP
ncbi:MAG TPA: 4-hydroxy-tetrahydrodipicolinate synthase [Xanthomonadales bacterium]|nr:4-hydroxy-tetrahydrodipicolinate synthase [Xanthomonadales bacterium]